MKQKGIIGIVCLLFAMLLLSMQTVQAVSETARGSKLYNQRNVEVVSQPELYQTTKLDIPDPEFRKWIWNNVLNQREDLNGGVEATNYAIYESDLDLIQACSSIRIQNKSIHINDITGINYFEKLEDLRIFDLYTDVISISLPELHDFYIYGSYTNEVHFDTPKLYNLTFTLHRGMDSMKIDLPSLNNLNITQSGIKELELYAPKLDRLDISGNDITEFDLNINSLSILYIYNNKLGSLDLNRYSNLKTAVLSRQYIDNILVHAIGDGNYQIDFTQIADVDPARVYNVLEAMSYDIQTGIAVYSTLPDKIQYTYDVQNKAVQDMVVIAEYEIVNEHMVTFMDGFSDDPIKVELVKTGDSATAPTPPKVEGYRFIGWDSDFSEVVADMVVTALYEKVVLPTPTYKIDFNTMGGILLPQQEYELGSVIQLDMVPIREGYKFVGWYLDEQYEMSVSEIVVSEDLTIYAKWEEIESPLPPVVEPDEEDKPLPPVVEPEEEDKPLPPVVEPEEEDEQLPPVVEPEEEDKPLPPVVAPEEEGSTSPEMKPESPQGDENPTEKPPGTGTQSQLAWMMLLLVVSLFGFFLVKQNRV